MLPQCEALRTCRSGFPTATVAQRIHVVSILIHEAQPVLGLFCLLLNTIDSSRHVTRTKAETIGWGLTVYGLGLGSVPMVKV